MTHPAGFPSHSTVPSPQATHVTKPPEPGQYASSRIASLDGLRAIAVLIVFIGHGSTDRGQWPGHAGVTIFFFLSGFLITTLLRREQEDSNAISLRRFYLRRTFRILPAAYFAVTVSALLGLIGWLPSTTTMGGVLAELLSFTNYYTISGGTGLPPDTSQMWTLAVEEQYYLVTPVALLLAYRAGVRRTTIGWCLVAVATIAPAWRIWLGLNGADFNRIYSSTDTRLDNILWGAALALLLNPVLNDTMRRFPRCLRWVSAHLPWLAAAAAAVFVATAIVPSLSFRLSIADTVQSLCLVPIFWFLITRPNSRVGRIFNSVILVRIGVLSFSIYLLHKMVLALISPTMNAPILTDLLSLGATILVAQVTYWLIEEPFRKLRRRIEKRLLRR